MKLINKFGLAVLLIAFLAVPSLAEKHHGGETTHHSESYRKPQAAPSTAPKMQSSHTQTDSRIPPPVLEKNQRKESQGTQIRTIMKRKHETVKNKLDNN
jgi:hypothetical protein